MSLVSRSGADLFDIDYFIPFRPFERASQHLIESRTAYRAETVDDMLKLVVDVPGSKASDITLSVHEQTLNVRSKRSAVDYKINREYDLTSASAEVEDGVLTLLIPKKKGKNGVTIPVVQK